MKHLKRYTKVVSYPSKSNFIGGENVDDNSNKIVEEIEWILFENRNALSFLEFVTWTGNGNSFVVADDNGEEYYKDVEVQEFNLYNIRNRALLKELIQFNSDGNFDRVRALGMVMLYRQQYLILYGGDVKEGVESYDDSDYLGNDPFFTNNYGV